MCFSVLTKTYAFSVLTKRYVFSVLTKDMLFLYLQKDMLFSVLTILNFNLLQSVQEYVRLEEILQTEERGVAGLW